MKNVPVKTAAEMLGKSQQFVRVALQRGVVPFGFAVKMSSRWTYYISPAKLMEYITVVKGGDENELISASENST